MEYMNKEQSTVYDSSFI